MKYVSPFVLPVEQYQRDLDIVKHYIKQNAWFLHKQTNVPLDECEDWVVEQIKPGGQFEIQDPVIHHTYRPDGLDRHATSSGYLQYLRTAIREDDIIAPTGTRYINPKRRRSIQTASIERNKAKRSKNKKGMFQAERDGQAIKDQIEAAKQAGLDLTELEGKLAKTQELYTYYKIAQTGNKLSNNAVSGAYCSASTIIFNPSAHTSLTSTCRITSGYGNANNEKLLSGNRHYYHPEIVLDNLKSVCHSIDAEHIRHVTGLYNLHTPTHEETFELIMRSFRLYRRNHDEEQAIWELVRTLSAEERIAFAYTGDLYHMRVFNDTMMREFINDFTRKIEVPHTDPDSVFARVDDAYMTVACQINSSFMNGKELFKMKGTREYALVAATLENMLNVLDRYRTLFGAFLLTRDVPASLAYFPQSVRRTVLMSDTDSTIFTTQDWVQWATDSLEFNERSVGVCEAILFIAGQSITHCLALMSANLGIEQSRMFETAMKNEFRFDTFIPTMVAKHYYALIGRQELNSYIEHKSEIKGVHLVSKSKASAEVMNAAAEMMVGISKTVLFGGRISLINELQRIATMEHDIIDALRNGSSTYFQTQKVKDKGTYKKDENSSPYQHYKFWVEVMEPKYGTVDPPPFPVLKVNSDINNQTQWNAWLDSMRDQDLANRIRDFCKRYNKKIIKTFYFPKAYVLEHGLPREFHNIINTRRIILDNTKVFYLIMESLGYFTIDKANNKLAKDIFPRDTEDDSEPELELDAA